jgi:hypothetical protein
MNPLKNMNTRTFLTVIGILLFVFTQQLNAQPKTYNEEITVIGAYDPIIPDAFKISLNPEVNDTTTTVPRMNYSVVPRDAKVQLEIEKLPAVKLVAEPLAKLYRNYVKAGVGNYNSLYGELFASSLRSKEYLLGLHLKHLSSDGKIKGYGPTGNSNQVAELYGQRYFENHNLSGKVYLNRQGLHLYGFKTDEFTDTLIPDKSLKQRYLVGGADVRFSSRYRADDRLNHQFGVSYYYLGDKYKVKENNVKITAALDKKYDLFKWEEKQVLGLNASFNLLNQKDSASKITASVLTINPNIKATFNEYTLRGGLGFYFGIDTVTKPHLYPELEGRIDLVKGALQLYAGIDGGMERNSILSLSTMNPYITSGLPLNYTYNKFRAYGGFSSNISRTFNFNGSISSTTFENYPFFITDSNTVLKNTFTLVYDDISMMKIKGELEFVKAGKFRLGLMAGYYSFNLGEQEYAWYKPEFDFSFSSSYDFQNKIMFKLKATYTGSVWAPVMPVIKEPVSGKKSFTAEKIDGWLDLNLGIEYKFKKALSFWLNINNLTGNQHFYWHNYPSYRVNLLGGVSYSF